MEKAKKDIVILGAGFGGLTAAKTLGEIFLAEERLAGEYRIVLIDKHAYQLYTPTLYEIATTSATNAKNIELERIVTFPIRDAVKGIPVTFMEKEVSRIDLPKRRVIFADGGDQPWEHLIVACGAETHFFDIQGLEAASYPLKTLVDAVRVRDAIESAFSDPEKKPIRIVVGGAGSTGVEFSAELTLWASHLEKRYKKRGVCRITLIEAAPEILGALDRDVMELARKRIEDLGVVVRTDAPIAAVKENEVMLADGEKIPFDILVWSGGVRAGRMLAGLEGIKREARGRPEVEETLTCIQTGVELDVVKHILVIGDVSCFKDPKTQKPIAGVARAAIEEGKIAAYNVAADIRGFEKKKFTPRHYPYVIAVGGKWAVAKLGRFTVSGLAGWILKGLVELRYLASVLPLTLALKIWIKGFWIFIRND